MAVTLHLGDCLDVLRTLDDASVHCVVTSPPYFNLRDYGVDGQIGLEPTPDEYAARMVGVFREVRRVLRHDGTLWLNLGDSYASGEIGRHDRKEGRRADGGDYNEKERGQHRQQARLRTGLGHKQLLGIPWRVAFALQADGWYLRSDIIWHKPNPMPESVRDRPTKAHEYLFLMSKSARYHYDADAVAEAAIGGNHHDLTGGRYSPPGQAAHTGSRAREVVAMRRNRRSVWTIAPKPFRGCHFATMPPALVEPCILAGCPEGGTVLDPFAGAGTVPMVAASLGRDAIGIELNPEYHALSERRIADAAPTLAGIA
jgi:DNA modification methylase